MLTADLDPKTVDWTVRFVQISKPITLSTGSIAILSTLILVILHFLNWRVPFLQRKIIVIVSLVIYYSIDSMISIMVVKNMAWGLIMEAIRCLYESILIFNFFQLVAGYVSYDKDYDKEQKIHLKRIYAMLLAQGEFKQVWPLTCFIKPLKIYNESHSKKIYDWLRFGINQFGIVNPIMCILEIVIYLSTNDEKS